MSGRDKTMGRLWKEPKKKIYQFSEMKKKKKKKKKTLMYQTIVTIK